MRMGMERTRSIRRGIVKEKEEITRRAEDGSIKIIGYDLKIDYKGRVQEGRVAGNLWEVPCDEDSLKKITKSEYENTERPSTIRRFR